MKKIVIPEDCREERVKTENSKIHTKKCYRSVEDSRKKGVAYCKDSGNSCQKKDGCASEGCK